MVIDDFNRTMDFWIRELDRYTFKQLCAKPSPDKWSMGQVYMHLIDATEWYMEQVEICTLSNHHASEDSSPAAKEMFRNNCFPDEIMEGPPSNADTPQPESKEEILTGLLNLKVKMKGIAASLLRNEFKGKTKHPGLNYFDAREWLQFAEMHLRHHFRQKERIDNFLKHSPEILK